MSLSIKLFQNHLARDRLRDFDHRREIQLFDAVLRLCLLARARARPAQLRMEFVELPHLSIGSPSDDSRRRASRK